MQSQIKTANMVFRLLLTLIVLVPPKAFSHTCPPDASATGVGVTVTALRTNGVAIGSGTVAPCEPIIIQMSILYFEVDPITLGKNAAFEAGGMNLFSAGRFDANVTPIGGVPLMGNPGECPGALGFVVSQRLNYVVTQADVLAGEIEILATYANGNAHIGEGNLIGVVSGTQGFTIRVRPGPSCSIAPQSQTICAGASATFTGTGTNGTAPYTFIWSGPNGFTFTGPVLTINNAQPSQSGTYNVVIRDFFGCTNTCFATLTVNPAPTCSITGPTNVCHASTNTHTANVNPPTPGVTFRWTVTGQGQIVGADNQPTVQVRTTGSGSYTVNNVLASNGCSNSCSQTTVVRICDVRILLTKEVVCWTPDGCAPFTGSDTAVGARSGNQCPSFCYRITVQNVSPPGVEIRNLVVQDNQLNLSSCNFPTTLTSAGTPGASFSCTIQNVTHCQNVMNTVTVDGGGFDTATGGFVGPVRTNDSARVIIVPFSVICEKTVSSPDDTEAGSGVTLPGDGSPHPVIYGVTVSNPSALPLVVHIMDPSLQNCSLPQEFTDGVQIAAGETLTWSNICTAMLQCGVEPLNGPFTNTIFVTAVVDTSETNLCPFASDGSLITASNDCSAVVQCPEGAGCTPGFWKNCTIHWRPTGFTTGQSINSVFNLGGCCNNLGTLTLRQALDLGGGPGVCGGAQNLLRAAVAALLNASSTEVDYPLTRAEVIARVNAALATCKRGPMIALAGELDRNNNLGCKDSNGNGLPCHRLSTP